MRHPLGTKFTMGQYCQLARVKLYVTGKIRFTESTSDENLMPNAFANVLIAEAEGALELELSERYMTPFQDDAGNPFNSILNATTRRVITTLAELGSAVRLLETDFGRGSTVDGDKYKEKLETRYNALRDRIVGHRKVNGEETMQWKYPPLPMLRLNYFNTEADDGYNGRIYMIDSGRGDFPADQINSPSENFWNGTIDSLESESVQGQVPFVS